MSRSLSFQPLSMVSACCCLAGSHRPITALANPLNPGMARNSTPGKALPQAGYLGPYPFITANGRNLATFRASPAPCTTSTTASMSL